VAQARRVAPDALPHRPEILGVLLVEREQRRAPEEEAQLVTAKPIAPEFDGPGDDEESSGLVAGFRVVLELRPLPPVDDVFHRERVQLVLDGERVDRLETAQPIDVDPATWTTTAGDVRRRRGRLFSATFSGE
jgi:hypothetical protein